MSNFATVGQDARAILFNNFAVAIAALPRLLTDEILKTFGTESEISFFPIISALRATIHNFVWHIITCNNYKLTFYIN